MVALRSDVVFIPVAEGVEVRNEARSRLVRGRNAHRLMLLLAAELGAGRDLEAIATGHNGAALRRLCDSLRESGFLVRHETDVIQSCRAEFRAILGWISERGGNCSAYAAFAERAKLLVQTSPSLALAICNSMLTVAISRIDVISEHNLRSRLAALAAAARPRFPPRQLAVAEFAYDASFVEARDAAVAFPSQPGTFTFLVGDSAAAVVLPAEVSPQTCRTCLLGAVRTRIGDRAGSTALEAAPASLLAQYAVLCLVRTQARLALHGMQPIFLVDRRTARMYAFGCRCSCGEGVRG